MTELWLLLVLLLGGVVGWLVRNWFHRRDLVKEQREMQRRQLGMRATLDHSKAGNHGTDMDADMTMAVHHS